MFKLGSNDDTADSAGLEALQTRKVFLFLLVLLKRAHV